MKRAFFMAFLLSAASVGCSTNSADTDSPGYQTVAKDPRRNSEAARADNEQALKRIGDKDWPGAEAAAKKALGEDVFFGPGHNTLGIIYFHEKKLYLSAWEFEYATKLMPNEPEPRNNLGLVFEASDKLDQAVDSYEQAMQIEPNQPQYVGNLARAQWSRGDRSDAEVGLLRKVIKNDDRPEWVDWAREQLAMMHQSP